MTHPLPHHDAEVTDMVATINRDLSDHAGAIGFDWAVHDGVLSIERRSGRGPVRRSQVTFTAKS